MNRNIKLNSLNSFIMKFDAKADLLNLRAAVNSNSTIRMKKGVHANEDFKIIFSPQFKYNEKLTDVATWYVNYANGGEGNYQEAEHLEKYYKSHLEKNDMVFWITTRSLFKTMHRLHMQASTEETWKITHDDFYTIVGRMLQTHNGKAGEWFEVPKKTVESMEFLV